MISEIVFFGDSWPRGAELELEVAGLNDKTTIQYSFPKLVGDLLGVPSKNYSYSGTSIPFLTVEFEEYLSSGTTKNAVAVFCVTAPDRFYWESATTGFVNIGPGVQDKLHKTFYAEFYSHESLRFYHSICLEFLKLKCEKLDIVPLFVPVFDTTDNIIDNPDRIEWLSDQSLYSILLGKDIGLDQVIRHHDLIRPCLRHPNTQGHKYLAEKIVQLLKEKNLC